MISAFRNGASDSLTVVGVKQGGPGHLRISLPSQGRNPTTWELYETTRHLDSAKVDTIVVRDGVAEIDLPDEAIFTLVGKIKNQ
jgi:hypothetical protein